MRPPSGFQVDDSGQLVCRFRAARGCRITYLSLPQGAVTIPDVKTLPSEGGLGVGL